MNSTTYQNYLTDTYIKDIRNQNRNRNRNLEYMVKELQHDISHNYSLIKSMHVRIKDLELEVLMLRNKDTPKKESIVRPPANYWFKNKKFNNKDSESIFLA
tara:strand:+ start:470 stop:772 length:303 start_codon:yes stop_codon:yes gene_type:complete